MLKKIAYFPKQKRVPTILTIDEIESILSIDIDYAAKKSFIADTNANYKLIWWIIASTGCRLEECLSLRKTDINLGIENGYVEFKDTKTDEDRRVPIPPILIYKLKEHLKNKKPDQLALTSSTGKKIASSLAEEDLKRRVMKASVEKHIYPHCFRNSYIMEHLRQGTDPLTIAKLVGHRDVNSTLGYTKYNYDDLLRGAENHPLFSRSISTQKILQKARETFDKLPIKHDPRFTYKIQESKNNLTIEISTESSDN